MTEIAVDGIRPFSGAVPCAPAVDHSHHIPLRGYVIDAVHLPFVKYSLRIRTIILVHHQRVASGRIEIRRLYQACVHRLSLGIGHCREFHLWYRGILRCVFPVAFNIYERLAPTVADCIDRWSYRVAVFPEIIIEIAAEPRVLRTVDIVKYRNSALAVDRCDIAVDCSAHGGLDVVCSRPRIASVICGHVPLSRCDGALQIAAVVIFVQVSPAAPLASDHERVYGIAHHFICLRAKPSVGHFCNNEAGYSRSRVDLIEVQTVLVPVQEHCHQVFPFAVERQHRDIPLSYREIHFLRGPVVDIICMDRDRGIGISSKRIFIGICVGINVGKRVFLAIALVAVESIDRHF